MATVPRAPGRIMAALRTALAALPLPWSSARLLRTLSLPRLRAHALRTSLTVLGVALGVAVMMAVILVNRSIMESANATVDDISGKAQLQVASGTMGFDESLLERIRAQPGVYIAAGLMQQTVMLHEAAGSERLLILGVDLVGEEDQYFRSYSSPNLEAIQRDPLTFLNATNNIIISRSLADRFGYKLHDRIRLGTSRGVQSFEIWDVIDSQGVGRAFGGAVAIMYYPAMQVAFDRPSKLDRIDIALKPGVDLKASAAAIKAELGQSFSVEQPSRRNDRVGKMLVGLRAGLTMASLIAVMVGMFLIYNTMTINIVQRKRELGILRAIGMARWQLMRYLWLEGLSLGVVGSAFGVLAGAVLARLVLHAVAQGVSAFYVPVAASSAGPVPALLASGFLIGVVATTVATWIPARRSLRIQPAMILCGSAKPIERQLMMGIGRGDLMGLALLASSLCLVRLPTLGRLAIGAFAACITLILAAALFMPRVVYLLHRIVRWVGRSRLGPTAKMANENLRRDLGRSASTASALMVGVAMGTGFAAFVGSFVSSINEWVDQTAPADVFVTSGGRLGDGFNQALITDALTDAWRAMPDVDFIQRLRIDEIEYQDSAVKLLSTDMDAYAKRTRSTLIEGGDMHTMLEGIRRGGVAVSDNFSRRFRVHRGDSIALSTKSGSQRFEVVGVIVDYTSDLGTVFLERQRYLAAWADTRVSAYELYLRPGADIEAVRRSIVQGYGEKYDLFVLTNREFKAEITHSLGRVFGLMRALELVALAIAVLGVVNALLASVIDRQREIGVLRAVGMLRSQVRRMVVIEATLVGLAGSIAGVFVGLWIGHLLLAHINLVQTGWHFPYRPSWRAVLENASIVVAAAAGAGYYPARRASGIAVADALAYE